MIILMNIFLMMSFLKPVFNWLYFRKISLWIQISLKIKDDKVKWVDGIDGPAN